MRCHVRGRIRRACPRCRPGPHRRHPRHRPSHRRRLRHRPGPDRPRRRRNPPRRRAPVRVRACPGGAARVSPGTRGRRFPHSRCGAGRASHAPPRRPGRRRWCRGRRIRRRRTTRHRPGKPPRAGLRRAAGRSPGAGVERAEGDGQARALLHRLGERPGGLLMRGFVETLLGLQRLPAFAMAGKRAFGPGPARCARPRPADPAPCPASCASPVSTSPNSSSCAIGQSRARFAPAGFTSPVISAWKRSTRSIM